MDPDRSTIFFNIFTFYKYYANFYDIVMNILVKMKIASLEKNKGIFIKVCVKVNVTFVE